MAGAINSGNSNQSVDEQIFNCLNLDNPKSFFLFAGAGSGKTRSLVNALDFLREQQGEFLRINRKRVAVITYTNAACDEIKHRIHYDPLFYVCTIHSFVWELIKNYQSDIREWLRLELKNDILELQAQLQKGKAGTKIATDRQNSVIQKSNRLIILDQIRQFSYSPTGDNRTRDSLNHSEVIKIASEFLMRKPLMQEVLVRKFPILFIDESQDTKKELIESFFVVQQNYQSSFSLGLFGDTMQRIYNDGKENLGKDLPPDWVTPVKKINYRCPKRVIALINSIRKDVDEQTQVPKDGQVDGDVRIFVVSQEIENKAKIETDVSSYMAELTKDDLWTSDVKTLILEHHMAAKRIGFFSLFEALYKSDILRIGLLDGSLPGLRFFIELILPLKTAYSNNDSFTIARIVKQYSPLLTGKNLKDSKEQMALLKKANEAVQSLGSLWGNDDTPTLLQIISNVDESGLFSLPDTLSIISKRASIKEYSLTRDNGIEESIGEENDLVIDAWDEALKCSVTEVQRYSEYISDQSKFGTHQGVKGLEFPRVMLILNDEEARGFLFSYEKLFGAKSFSEADVKNRKEGRETSFDRTRRLFYVACSRAEKSLAIVAYTKDSGAVKNSLLRQQWFASEEIVMM
ncbi:UvrD-helicase domain-containing protein [Chitinophaga sp. 22321]|uniref:DNA 3'-5' helicase II n=1 Tax=Chitinophaga hostae TaxID=2831022 RepID=A0ABS5JB38_9BACT|nr:UvrD-helicase domain-containing protein [Chitinophaga hostae]MBS0032414.1 ATP-dependent helicase [Chitinophaga hostae]